LRLKILPVNPLNAIFCEDFLAAALCFQDFAEKGGEGVAAKGEEQEANSE
jgi:hypothetical protein